MKSVFKLGVISSTSSIVRMRDVSPKFDKDVIEALAKYRRAEWSDTESPEDKRANDAAIASGNERIFASYETILGKIYIITESDHSITTILFADEY